MQSVKSQKKIDTFSEEGAYLVFVFSTNYL